MQGLIVVVFLKSSYKPEFFFVLEIMLFSSEKKLISKYRMVDIIYIIVFDMH